MVLLNSENIPLETPAPHFILSSVEGKKCSIDDFKDKKVLAVMFICAHCPYVQAIEDRIIQLRKDFEGKSVQFVGICSNDPTDYPEDKPENLRKRAEKKGYGFPYLVDITQEVAKAYGAICTPDIYVYDSDRKLAYHGRIDDNWKDPNKVTKHELREAIETLLAGRQPSPAQMSSMGCSIKWKK
jgi:peroxiredoxin